jgi:hypothetical protein
MLMGWEKEGDGGDGMGCAGLEVDLVVSGLASRG